MITLGLVVLILLIIMSLMDITTRTVPSVFGSLIIFVIVVVAGTTTPSVLLYGVAGLIFGLMLWELDFFKGVADVKVLTILGLSAGTFHNFIMLMVFMMIVVGLSLIVTKVTIKQKEIAFLPYLTLAYFLLWTGGFVVI